MNEKFNSMTKYCITLLNTPERTNAFVAHSKSKGLTNFQFYYGLHPMKLPPLKHPVGSAISVGQTLLTFNHYALWNIIAMQENQKEYYMIFEDDAVFNTEDYDAILATIPNGAEFVSFGAPTDIKWDKKDKIVFNIANNFPCTHAYAITPQTARKMIELTEGTDMWNTIDWYLIANIYKHLKTYICNWPTIGQRTVGRTTPEKQEWPSVLGMVYKPTLENGSFIGGTAKEHCYFDEKLAQKISTTLKENGTKSVLDLGCGAGQYVKFFEKQKFISSGVDGNPYIERLSAGKCICVDLSKPYIHNELHDWVVSLEVGEHISPEHEDVFIDNIHKNNRLGAIVSWAILGQGGLQHVNERDNEYIKSKFIKLGYINNLELEQEFRNAATFKWFKNSLMVFEKS